MSHLNLGLSGYYSLLDFLAGETFYIHANCLNFPLLNGLNVLSSLDVRMRESFDNVTYVNIGHVLQATGILLEDKFFSMWRIHNPLAVGVRQSDTNGEWIMYSP